MESLSINFRDNSSIEFYTDSVGSIIVGLEAEGMSENFSIEKEISKETLKSYIVKLQCIYDSIK